MMLIKATVLKVQKLSNGDVLHWTKVFPSISFTTKETAKENSGATMADLVESVSSHNPFAELDSKEEEARQEPNGLEKFVDELASKF
jgi:hypothetical protein